MTIGVEFDNFAMIVNNESLIKLQIWDTAGEEKFRSITRVFYKDAHVVFFVFDLTRRETLDHVREWKAEVESNTLLSGTLCYLVGCKADKQDER